MAQTLVLFVFTAKHKRFSVPKQPPFMAFINFSGTTIQVVENLFRLHAVETVRGQQFKRARCARQEQPSRLCMSIRSFRHIRAFKSSTAILYKV